MSPLIHEIESLIGERDITLVSDKIIDAFKKDRNSINQEVDYALLEVLFRLDLSLEKKSNALWKKVSESEIIAKLPQYLKDYICKVLKNKPISDICSYRKKLESYGDVKAFQYLIACCWIVEGSTSEDKAKIERGMDIFESLMWQTERSPGSTENYDLLNNSKLEPAH